MATSSGFMRLDPIVARELKQKWYILAIAMITVVFAFSLPAFAPQNIYDYLERDFGWTRAQITALATSKYLMGFLVAISVGIIIDRLGVKKVLLFVSTVGAISMSAFYFVPNLMVYYGIGILMGIATTGSIVALKVFISRSFDHAVGVAFGITLMGMSLGQLIVPYLVNWLIPVDDVTAWRTGMLQMSLFIWCISLPVLIFGLNEKTIEANRTEASKKTDYDLSFWDLLKDKRFWLLAYAVTAVGFVDQAYIQNARFLLVADLGVTTEMFAYLITVYAIAGVLARPALGLLADIISVKGVALVYVLMGATALLTLPLVASAPLMLIFWMALRGISHSGVMIDDVIVVKHTFGAKNMGLILGLLTGFVNLGFATGPVLMAYISDTTGSYALAHIIFGAVSFSAAVIILMIKPEVWLAGRAARAEERANELAAKQTNPSPTGQTAQ